MRIGQHILKSLSYENQKVYTDSQYIKHSLHFEDMIFFCVRVEGSSESLTDCYLMLCSVCHFIKESSVFL